MRVCLLNDTLNGTFQILFCIKSNGNDGYFGIKSQWKGINMNDGKLYTGGWSNNKMHGRGREKFSNGECFLVYYKNGYRIDALASK